MIASSRRSSYDLGKDESVHCVIPWKVFSYGKPSGAKFKKQNWPHVQQICCQGQEKFQCFFEFD